MTSRDGLPATRGTRPARRSDDRLAKTHTCAYKPGPKLILQIQVTDGVGTEEQFENAIKLLTERTPVEGIGEKAYFIPRTEPPIGIRLYLYAKGVMVLVNIGREDLRLTDLETTARDLASVIIGAI